MSAALRFAVLGSPIGHSRSPSMYAAAYRALGLPHTYEKIHTDPGDLKARVDELRAGYWGGLNITVPLKTRVLEWVDDVAPSAALIGAANTLVRSEAGRIVAHNTDLPALEAELASLRGGDAPLAHDAVAIVLGTGGAARAAVGAVAQMGVRRVVVRGRGDVEGFAQTMRAALPAIVCTAEPLAPSGAEAAAAMVVQATSVGMIGGAPGDAVVAAVGWSDLRAGGVALDVVYAPPQTPFVFAARARGLRACGGLGMLARQGAFAFSLWLGLPPPYEVMRQVLV